jgi:pimeloyl-ACP methyl ester carboxylesterase
VTKLSAPVTVVVAADDSITSAFQRRYRDWELLVEHVELHEIPDGGHYFVRTQPTQAAHAVLGAAKLLAYS